MLKLDIFFMLLVYVIVVTAFILSHVFISYFMKNYKNDLTKKKNFWLGMFSECKKKGTYLLKKSLIKKLKNATMFAAFSDAYNEAAKNDPHIKSIMYDNQIQIAEFGSKLKSTTMRAFFAYMLSGFGLCEPGKHQCFDDLMLSYLSDDSVYVHENALLALYSFGNEKSIAEAFAIISERNIFYSEKLLNDGLLKFTGNREKLAEKLMDIFGKLNECFKVAVINFLRYTGNRKYDTEFICLLDSGDTPTNIKYCIIRLLSKFHSTQNGEAILKALEDNYNSESWEPAAVAASSLVPYNFENIIKVLIRALNSKA